MALFYIMVMLELLTVNWYRMEICGKIFNSLDNIHIFVNTSNLNMFRKQNTFDVWIILLK